MGLKDILTGYVTNLGVKVIEKAPGLTRSTLEKLLQQDPEAFKKIVPQGIDKQTGLYSKQYFEEDLLPKRLSEAELNGVPVSYVLVDIDNLKRANDTDGHEAGDAVIKYVTDLVNSSFRMMERRKKRILVDIFYFFINGRGKKPDRREHSHHGDLVARIDKAETFAGRVGYGDEFGILLYGCDQKQALEIINRFIDKVRSGKAQYEKKEIPVTVSIGVAEYEARLSLQELIGRADKALYTAKESGRNTVKTHPAN